MLKWKRVQFFDSQCSVTSNNMKLVHWPLIGKLLHLVQRGGDWAGPQPTQSPPRCTKCNSRPLNDVQRPVYTNHRIAVWSPMLCGFNVPIKGLSLLGQGTQQKWGRRCKLSPNLYFHDICLQFYVVVIETNFLFKKANVSCGRRRFFAANAHDKRHF